MKKLFAFLLMLVMLASLTAGAFAADELSFDNEAAGFRFSFSDEFKNTVGTIRRDSYGEVGGLLPDIYLASYTYIGMTWDEYKEKNGEIDALLAAGGDAIEKADEINDQIEQVTLDALFVVAAAAKDLEEEYYQQLILRTGTNPERILLAEKDGYVFYQYDYSAANEAKLSVIKPEFAEEYRRLEAAFRDALSKAEFFFFLQSKASALKGMKLSFETKDLDGNPVKSEEIFQQNEITMLNIWATWCNPCIGELHFLDEFNGRLKEQNCAVVGLLYDGTKEKTIEKGKALLAEEGAGYLNLAIPKDLKDQLGQLSLPTSLLVDRSGTVVFCITGANTSSYEPVIQKLLGENKPKE